MTTSEIVKALCSKKGVSQAQLAKGIGQTAQNFFKKMKRESLTLDELEAIAEYFKIRYEQAFILEDGSYISTTGIVGGEQSALPESRSSYRERFDRVTNGLKTTVRETIRKYIESVTRDVADRERERGIQYAAEALLDGGCSEEHIVRSLEKYWSLDNSQAVEALEIIKTQVHPKSELRELLKSKGYPEEAIRLYMVSNRVGPELRTRKDLWRKSPKELKQYFDSRRSEVMEV